MSVKSGPIQRLGILCAPGLVLLACACGPVVATDPVEASSSTSGAVPQTSSGPNPSTTTGTPPNPTTASTSVTTSPGTTSGTTTGLDDSESSSGELSGGFITTPDGGACVTGLPDGVLAHCTIECSLQDQDCGSGEACRSWANDGSDVWRATRCVPLDPEPAGVGEPCLMEGSPVSGVDTCDLGLMCWTVDPQTLEGSCAQYCGVSKNGPACSQPGTTCVIANEGWLPLCLPACDPLAPTCAAGFGCYPGSQGDFACIREGDRAYVNGLFHPECPAGTFWANAEQVEGCNEDDPCCVEYCQLSAPGSCGLDLECAAFFDDPEPEYEELGYCRPAGG